MKRKILLWCLFIWLIMNAVFCLTIFTIEERGTDIAEAVLIALVALLFGIPTYYII